MSCFCHTFFLTEFLDKNTHSKIVYRFFKYLNKYNKVTLFTKLNKHVQIFSATRAYSRNYRDVTFEYDNMWFKITCSIHGLVCIDTNARKYQNGFFKVICIFNISLNKTIWKYLTNIWLKISWGLLGSRYLNMKLLNRGELAWWSKVIQVTYSLRTSYNSSVV